MRATIVSSLMPSPPGTCIERSTTRQVASEQITLAMLDWWRPRSPAARSAPDSTARFVDQTTTRGAPGVSERAPRIETIIR
jgi:hypothetical protein